MMGKVAVTLKVMLSSPEVSAEEIAKKISNMKIEDMEIKETNIEDVAFGLKAVKVLIVIPDEKGEVLNKVESEIRNVDGVSEVEVENTTLL